MSYRAHLATCKGSKQNSPSPGTQNTVRAAVRVAVLYTGRWFWPTNGPWVRNHLEKLIEPNDAEVMLIATWETFCSPAAPSAKPRDPMQHAAAEALLQEEVKAAFGKHVLPHGARLVEEPEPKRIKGMMGIMRESVRRVNATLDAGFYANSAFKASSMFSWRKQTRKAALVEMLRRSVMRQHDLIVRTRIDMDIFCTLPVTQLHPIQPRRIYAVQRHIANTSLLGAAGAAVFCDWLYVTGLDGMAAFVDMGNRTEDMVFDAVTRCYGFCPEEQTRLQLARRGFDLAPLPDPPWHMNVQRLRDLLARRKSTSSKDLDLHLASKRYSPSIVGLREGCDIGYDMRMSAPPLAGAHGTSRTTAHGRSETKGTSLPALAP